MQRVLVIGSPGAGKSTLARALAQSTGLPVHHLDRMHWLPGWVERDRAEGRMMLEAVLASPQWIIDGNYGSTLPLRLERADTVVWLDYPTRICLWRAISRWWRFRGQARPDMTEGCLERLDLEFLLYILNFRRGWGQRNAKAMAAFTGKVIRHSSPDQTADWLAALS